MGEDQGDKTEEPTPHKLREARKKGQIVKSKEFTSAVLLLVSFYVFRLFAIQMWTNISTLLTSVFQLFSQEISTAIIGLVLRNALMSFFLIVGPVFAAGVITALIMESVQAGFLFTAYPLEPKLDSLNPINGFKKFFSLKQYVELFKSLIKMALVIWILYSIIREEYFVVSQAQARNIWNIVAFVGSIVIKTITRVGILYLILAILDYFYQRYEFMKSMRMSKKEIKDEYKRLEGDPTIKQRQRQAQREMAQGRQMGAVPGADVVVTNPVHIAIAIGYDQKKDRAPTILAKGQRLNAEDIKAIAESHYIPIIENPPLAQALFKSTHVGQEIPEETYRTVAEILAFIYHLKRNRPR